MSRWAGRMLLLSAAVGLAACQQQSEGESADDFARRIDGQSNRAAPVADLPQPAKNGREALSYASSYSQPASGGDGSELRILSDGTYSLTEDGRTVTGRYEWLPDGKRLRLVGVERRPIVVVADGALYRVTNEDVPLDDLTPDRMYAPAGDQD